MGVTCGLLFAVIWLRGIELNRWPVLPDVADCFGPGSSNIGFGLEDAQQLALQQGAILQQGGMGRLVFSPVPPRHRGKPLPGQVRRAGRFWGYGQFCLGGFCLLDGCLGF